MVAGRGSVPQGYSSGELQPWVVMGLRVTNWVTGASHVKFPVQFRGTSLGPDSQDRSQKTLPGFILKGGIIVKKVDKNERALQTEQI